MRVNANAVLRVVGRSLPPSAAHMLLTLVILGVFSCPHVPRYIYMYLQYASKKSYHTVEINCRINGPASTVV